MPELPDLQVFSRNLQKALHGKTVAAITVHSKKLNVTATALKKALAGSSIKAVKREGKELHITFDNNAVLGLHLMLHGQLFLYDDATEPRHTVIALQFDDGSSFAMADYQGAATPTLNPPQKEAPDALAKEADADFLKTKLGATRSAVKTVLLDQKVIRGVGNAYADEILWDAGIAPQSASNKIPGHKIKQLAISIRKVLEHAEKEIIKHDPKIISGEVRDFLLIHNAKKTHSPGGAIIKHATINGRKTYYTDEQEVFS